jgi:hypothetical protein
VDHFLSATNGGVGFKVEAVPKHSDELEQEVLQAKVPPWYHSKGSSGKSEGRFHFKTQSGEVCRTVVCFGGTCNFTTKYEKLCKEDNLTPVGVLFRVTHSNRWAL